MGWFWAENSCPHPVSGSNATSSSGCPMRNFSLPKSSVSPVQQPSAKPYDFSTMSRALHATTTNSNPAPSTLSRLNPLNYMPTDLSQSRAQNQKIQLPVERTISSIPRGDADAYWEYPSPQQMYNAMLRKGYDDTPEDAVESMVAVHNFLNEGAWREIEGWEEIFSRGLGYGWQTCRMGNDGFDKKSSKDAGLKPKLLRFQGRPTEPTPKARVLQFMGKIYPSKFGGEPPFDRHDWYVLRKTPDGEKREIRYVIDYYSAPPEPTGEPVFYLDVRPAIDGPTAAAERMMRWGGDIWSRASGAKSREDALS